jgi:protein required for attachment to host cells
MMAYLLLQNRRSIFNWEVPVARSYDPEPEAVVDHTPDDPAPPDPPPAAVFDGKRLFELKSKGADATPAEVEELAKLVTDERAASARLQVLRLKPAMTDAEKAEFDKLGLAEADAAGHPVPVENADHPMTPEQSMMSDILASLEHIAAVLPAAAPLVQRLAAMRQRLTDMISPPDKK